MGTPLPELHSSASAGQLERRPSHSASGGRPSSRGSVNSVNGDRLSAIRPPPLLMPFNGDKKLPLGESRRGSWTPESCASPKKSSRSVDVGLLKSPKTPISPGVMSECVGFCLTGAEPSSPKSPKYAHEELLSRSIGAFNARKCPSKGGLIPRTNSCPNIFAQGTAAGSREPQPLISLVEKEDDGPPGPMKRRLSQNLRRFMMMRSMTSAMKKR
mmetsp:Transcript_102318/g.298345  ORF Transcript_102318/g.298345 Transcript_102318/m.298345 type:complete len:214 (+) Transcript_102318:68-709(+)